MRWAWAASEEGYAEAETKELEEEGRGGRRRRRHRRRRGIMTGLLSNKLSTYRGVRPRNGNAHAALSAHRHGAWFCRWASGSVTHLRSAARGGEFEGACGRGG